MVSKFDIADFIIEKKKTSWSDLERQFVGPTAYKRSPCPKCKSSHIIVDQDSRELICGDCRTVVFSKYRIARQTLLNYIKALTKEGIIEKAINKETNKPVYQATEKGQKNLQDSQKKQKIIWMIIESANLQETLKEILKNLEENT